MRGMLRVECYVNRLLNSNTWIIASDNDAILVDCGDFNDIYRLYPYSFSSVFLTHIHADHIYGLMNLVRTFPDCTIFTSTYGCEALLNPKKNLSRYLNIDIFLDKNLCDLRVLREGDSITLFDNYKLDVFETPGHDKSCLTYKLCNYLFTGDSYIPGQKTVTSFPNGNRIDAIFSENKILSLANGSIICPGHSLLRK